MGTRIPMIKPSKLLAAVMAGAIAVTAPAAITILSADSAMAKATKKAKKPAPKPPTPPKNKKEEKKKEEKKKPYKPSPGKSYKSSGNRR